MSATVIRWTAAGRAAGARAPRARMVRAQVLAQTRGFWRTPAVSLTGLAMPLMLFVFFVMPRAEEPQADGTTVGATMLASIAAYAVSSMMVFNFGVSLAIERGQKVDVLMRAMPVPGTIYLGSRAIVALIFGALALGLLVATAIGLGGVDLEPAAWASLTARLLVGALPFIGFGFAVAYLVSPTGAPAVANVTFIALAFASGMFVPLSQMPDVMQTIAPLLPTYHYAQLAWGAVGAATESTLTSITWLVAYGVALFGLAGWAYRRESRRRFG
jgi:ABC-2 type transport system permease protein